MKRRSLNLVILGLLFIVQRSSSQPVPERFVLIKGATFNRGDVVLAKNRPLVRVEDFEILDHPVTNKEYKAFVDATGYKTPLHWLDGSIPAGKEDYPVIFVSRYDADAYLKWLSQQDGRVYRLPTYCEFEYASRGGLADKKYPWGDADPSGRANYDAAANRRFNRWQDYLQPARWGKPNGYGLYGMAGNAWNMVIRDQDPATYQFKYRIENIVGLERLVMGGSWARGAEYLRCGYYLGSFSVQHPDIGFRPVREPKGADWRIQPRKLCTISRGSGTVFLSWAMLKTDAPSVQFNLYRLTGKDRCHAGFLVNDKPLSNVTYFVDSQLTNGEFYQYYVRPADANGKEGRKSEWVGIQVTDQPVPALAEFKPLYQQGSLAPVFGDLNGDGTMDCVIRLNNGNEEMSQDPGIPIQLEAFTSYGRSLWRKDICYHDHCYGSANNNPFNVYDMDGDGKAEVITRLQVGDEVFVAILDGVTGALKYKTPWPPMVSDTQKSSTRIHMSIAYLDGVHPAVVTQTGLYEDEVFVAYDAQLNKLWEFDSFAETNGSGSHKIEAADVDGDGKQEVFDGTTCLNADGTLRWSIYRMHPDIVSISDYIPDRPGLEVYYAVESEVHAGLYMVDAKTGKIIWKINREEDPRWTHAHYGWTSDIWDQSPGIEAITNRAGHSDRDVVLYSAKGKILLEPFPAGLMPAEWDGDLTRELLIDNGHKIGNFDGRQIVEVPEEEPNPIPGSSLLMVADLYGDFRDELVLLTNSADGKKAVAVVTATEPIDKRFVARTEYLDYRLWLAHNKGGGYQSINCQPLVSEP